MNNYLAKISDISSFHVSIVKSDKTKAVSMQHMLMTCHCEK